jgi:hypothetical protein
MSALNLIGINFQQAKRKKKEQFDQSGWVILDKSSSYRIPKDSARKRKKGSPLPGQRVVMVVVEGTHI